NSVGVYRGEPDVSMFTTSNGPGSNGQNYGVAIVLNGSLTGPAAGTSLSSPLTAGILNSMNASKLYSTATLQTILYNNWGSNPNRIRDIILGNTKDNYNPNDSNQPIG